ncbi:DinI-like family protein, partial [Klebsiella pneumoniae]|uniref:DinI-like family protein n=2 Tax=Klebsiella pneumoniae TaxID=573 RepID=UPI00066927DD
MKVEVTIDKHKKLPDGAIPALEQELQRRLSQSYDDCKLTIRRTSNDGLREVAIKWSAAPDMTPQTVL